MHNFCNLKCLVEQTKTLRTKCKHSSGVHIKTMTTGLTVDTQWNN